MAKITYVINSHHNISFNHEVAEVDTSELADNWDDLTEDERLELIYDPDYLNDLVWENVEIYAKEIND